MFVIENTFRGFRIRRISVKTILHSSFQDIAAMKTIIGSMDADLEDYHRKNKLLQQDIGNLQHKQSGLQEEILEQRKKLADSTSSAKRVKHDLHNVMDSVRSVKDFKRNINEVCTKYLGKQPKPKKGEDGGSNKNYLLSFRAFDIFDIVAP